MFQFPGFPAYDYFIHRTLYGSSPYGFPHSDICGSKLICSSPQLFAACHVLLRLLMPRHSPCALSSLTLTVSQSSLSCFSNYAGTSARVLSSKLSFYPFLDQTFHNCFKIRRSYPTPLCCLAFLSHSFCIVQFSRCKVPVSLETRYYLMAFSPQDNICPQVCFSGGP